MDSKLKQQLDEVFSDFIRLRDSNVSGWCNCITCGAPHFYKYIDNGHFIPRVNMSTRYDERNCHAQCTTCNRTFKGELKEYAKQLRELYPEGDIVEELREKGRQTAHITDKEASEMIKHYKAEVKRLKKEKGIK